MATSRKKTASASTSSTKSRTAASRPPAERPVFDLKAIEAELNRDPQSQAAFLKNPSRFMDERGLVLRPADKAELKRLVNELTSGPKLPEGSEVSLSPTITISIKRRIGKFSAER